MNLKKHEHDADIMYVEGREILLGSLPLRYVASFRHAIWHGHNNLRPSHGGGSHWLAVHFLPKSSSAYFFDSYGIIPLVPNKAAFIRRNCKVWHYNRRKLEGLTSNICGKYFCLFALYMDRGFTAKQFVGEFDGASSADRQIFRAFASEFESPRRGNGGGVQCCSSFL